VFEPVRAEPTYRKVASAIAARIIDRSLAQGMPLPPELELAAQFGVNRSTVREALRELESGGLIERGKGTKRMVVAQPGGDALADRVSQALVLSDVTVEQVWEALMVLEPPAAVAAAVRRSDTDLARIDLAAQRFRRENTDSERAMVAVADYFSAIAVAAQNPVLALAQAPALQVLTSSLALLIDRIPQARQRVMTAQDRIRDAIAARDANDARLWMERHIRDFRRGFLIAGIDLSYRVSLAGTR